MGKKIPGRFYSEMLMKIGILGKFSDDWLKTYILLKI